MNRVALFGGIYSNHVALRAAIDDASRRGCDTMFCLGDLGAFGPNPDKIFPLLIDHDVQTLRGNYDDSIGNNLPDCQCGYTDPADNHFARLSYRYTYEKTSARWRPWLTALPDEIRFSIPGLPLKFETAAASSSPRSRNVLCCHGSPRLMNEFLWETTTPTHLLEKFCDDYQADIIVATHTGLPWARALSSNRLFINCGVLGRPANDGTPQVGYALLDPADPDFVQFIRLDYDHESLAAEMEAENLPPPFVETIRTGWWTTCLEILPGKERARGRY
jgi:predicted phosphodiesterase